MNDFFNKMDYIYTKSKNEMEISYNRLSLIEVDFEAFLSNFFYGDINKNMFMTGIFYEGPQFIKDFQDYVFKKCIHDRNCNSDWRKHINEYKRKCK